MHAWVLLGVLRKSEHNVKNLLFIPVIFDGLRVGLSVGDSVGETVGKTVGLSVGDIVGDSVGDSVGESGQNANNQNVSYRKCNCMGISKI